MDVVALKLSGAVPRWHKCDGAKILSPQDGNMLLIPVKLFCFAQSAAAAAFSLYLYKQMYVPLCHYECGLLRSEVTQCLQPGMQSL